MSQAASSADATVNSQPRLSTCADPYHRELLHELEMVQAKNMDLQESLRSKEQSTAQGLKEMQDIFREKHDEVRHSLEAGAAATQPLREQIEQVRKANAALELQLQTIEQRLSIVEDQVVLLNQEKQNREKAHELRNAQLLIGEVVQSFEMHFIEEVFCCAQEDVFHGDLRCLSYLLRIYKTGKLNIIYGKYYTAGDLDQRVADQLAALLKSGNFDCCKNEADLVKCSQDATKIGNFKRDCGLHLSADVRAEYVKDSKSFSNALQTFTKQYTPPVTSSVNRTTAKPIDGAALNAMFSRMITILAEKGITVL